MKKLVRIVRADWLVPVERMIGHYRGEAVAPGALLAIRPHRHRAGGTAEMDVCRRLGAGLLKTPFTPYNKPTATALSGSVEKEG